MINKSKFKKILFFVAIAVLAILIHGYQFGNADQKLIIPFSQKTADASLFPGDLLFSQSSAKGSLFYSVYGQTIKFADAQTVSFLGYFIFQLAFLYGVYRLAAVILNDQRLAYFAVLPFLLPKFVGGTANLTYDIFFSYRPLAAVCLIFLLLYLFERKYSLATVVCAIGTAIHPINFLPLILFVITLAYLDSKGKSYLFKILLSYFVFFVAFFLLTRPSSDFSLSSIFDSKWYSIMKMRDGYLFALSWTAREWLSLGLYLSLILVFVNQIHVKIRKPIFIILAVTFLIFGLNFLAVDILKISFLAQFQLYRIVFAAAYIGLILSALFLGSKNKKLLVFGSSSLLLLSFNKYELFILSQIIFVVIVFITKNQGKINLSVNKSMIAAMAFALLILFAQWGLSSSAFPDISYPVKSSDWIDMQLWAKRQTPKTAMFLVPPNETGFRVFSNRSIIADQKDGAAVAFSPKFAKEWSRRISDLDNYGSLSEANFRSLRDKYHFDYIVTRNNQQLNLKKIYQNNTYSVYAI